MAEIKSGTDLHRAIQLALGRGSCRMFRNEMGQGWVGEAVMQGEGKTLKCIIKYPRKVRFGVGYASAGENAEAGGGSDLIGWTTKIVTPDMVGQRVAIFTAIEGKFDDDDTTRSQVNFIAAVRLAGGFAGVASTVDDALAIARQTSGVHK